MKKEQNNVEGLNFNNLNKQRKSIFKYKRLNKFIFILFFVYVIGIFSITIYQVNTHNNIFFNLLNETAEKFCNHLIYEFQKKYYILNHKNLNRFYMYDMIDHIEYFDVINIKIFDNNKSILFDSDFDYKFTHLDNIFSENEIKTALNNNFNKINFVDKKIHDDGLYKHKHKNTIFYKDKYYVIHVYLQPITYIDDYIYEKTIKGFILINIDITDKYVIFYNNMLNIYTIGFISIVFIFCTLMCFMYFYTKVLDNDERLNNQLKHALDEANKINVLKDRFISTVSHEMRTPTQSIIGFLELIKSDIEEEINKDSNKINIDFLIKLLDNINISLRSSENLIFLINNILDYSKIIAGKFTLNRVTFDFCKMRTNLFDMFKLSAIKKNINITYNRNDQIPKYLVGDVNRIQQILINLIGNAIKFTHENGNIELSIDIESMDEKNITLLFTIKDDGIGIDPTTQESIFKPFTQANNTVNSGTGLGLTITKELITLMGGKIWFESKVDEGTTFYFTLKLEIGNEEDIKYEEKEDISYISKYDKILKILLVEDDKFVQQFVKKILNKQKHIVAIANNGVEAIEILSKSNFDIVIMDKQMPFLDGVETTIIIRNKTTSVLNHNIPIIAMTAISEEKDKKLLWDAGVNDIIIKPVKSIDLLTKLYKLVK